MQHKKYLSIERLKNNYTDGFKKSDLIVIQEKIDGANAAIRYDAETDTIIAQSRKNILSFSNTLRGFYEWTQTLDKELIKTTLGNNLCLFCEWLCLSGDTIIRKTSGGKNTNYMTLREMYKYKNKPRPEGIHNNLNKGRPFVFKNIKENPDITSERLFEIHNTKYYANFKKMLNWLINANYISEKNNTFRITPTGENWYNQYARGYSWWETYGFPSLFSLDFNTDKIVANKMMDIVYTGNKLVYEVKTRKGYTIKSTLEHRFLTPYGFKPLGELKEKDCVAISKLTNQERKGRTYGTNTKRIKAEQKEYKMSIKKCEVCGNTTCLEIHHKDGNHNNNCIDNYQVLCSDCHHKIPVNGFNGFEYNYEFDYIVSIKEVGIEDCYDIAMSGEENIANFVANGFIVHNCKHTVPYPDDKYNHAYCYDVFDTDTGNYLPQDKVKEIVNTLGLTYVPVFYEGEFTSWDGCLSYVGKTEMGGEYGEGIVVKNMTNLNSKNTRLPFYIKIVCPQFTETKGVKEQKVINLEEQANKEYKLELVKSIVTKERILKTLHKMVDENIIPVDWNESNMGVIAKNINSLVYHDCVKEEKEIVDNVGETFGKLCGTTCMRIVKEILLENK